MYQALCWGSPYQPWSVLNRALTTPPRAGTALDAMHLGCVLEDVHTILSQAQFLDTVHTAYAFRRVQPVALGLHEAM